MANEISATVSLQFAKGGVAAAPLAAVFNVNVAGSKYMRAVQSIGTAEEAIQIGELSGLGYGIFHNLDATNFLTVRMATAITPGLKLKPGEYCMFRLGGNAPFAIADTSACLLEYMIIED